MRRIISNVSVNCTVLSVRGVCRSDEMRTRAKRAVRRASQGMRTGGRTRPEEGEVAAAVERTERGNIVVVAPVSCRPCTV